MDTDPRQALTPPVAPMIIDPVLKARLARLSAHRAARDEHPPTGRTTPPSGPHRRRHAAQSSRTAALLMSIATTAGLAAYFQHVDSAAASDSTSTLSGVAVASGTAATTAATATSGSTASTSASTVDSTSTTTGSAASTSVSASSSSALADGTYTGATATNRWGPVQVQITVTGGQITEVVALQTPTADGKSISINARATPTLASEVLSAQNADIDTVSGATYTSDSYKASLQSAIDVAQSTVLQASASS